MARRFILLVFVLSLFSLTAALAEERPDEIYLEGTALFRHGDYEEAALRFMKILVHFPDSPYAADSVFKIGEGHFRDGRFEKAGSYYRLYLERYSLGRNVRDAKLRLSQCEAKAGRRIGAAHPRIQRADPPLRAIRVVRFYQSSKAALDRDIASWKSEGANALIVPAFHLGGDPHGFVPSQAPSGSYFHSSAVPLCNDVLPWVAGLVHKYKMRLIVEFPVRSLPAGPRDLDWDPVGSQATQSQKLDLFSKDGVQTAVSTIEDLSKVTIDGILLTDVTMTPLEGYSADGMRHYAEKTGDDVNLKALFLAAKESTPGNVKYDLAPGYGELAEVKAGRLSDVAGRLLRAVQQADPNLKVWVEVRAEGIDDPAEGLLRYSQAVEVYAKPPYSGIFLMVDPPHLTHAGALTAQKLSASIGRLLVSATVFTNDPSRIVFCMWIEDGITHKPAPDWQIESALQAGKEKDIEDFSAGPLKPGFDYRKVFSGLPGVTATEKKGE